MPEPKWDGQRWRIRAMKDGQKVSFSSSIPGRKGRQEVMKSYDCWLYDQMPGNKSVEKICEEYIDDLKARRGEHAASVYQNSAYIKLYILPSVGSKKINQVSTREWQNLINQARAKTGEPLSQKSLKNLRTVIMAIIKYGYEDYQCDLLRGHLYIPADRKLPHREVLQREDVARLLEPSDLWFHPYFCFLVVTGMRPGEALGLQISDIEGSSITIKRSINDRGYITPGKNENARRAIPLGATALGILRHTIQRSEALKLNTEWIFCSKDGSAGSQIATRKDWAKLKEERNLPGTIYSLRHTFISLMKSVMPEQAIKDIVGHSTSMDTFGIYGHIMNEDVRKSAELIDLTVASLGQIFGQTESASDGRSGHLTAESP